MNYFSFFLVIFVIFVVVKIIAYFEGRDIRKARKVAQEPLYPSCNHPAPVRSEPYKAVSAKPRIPRTKHKQNILIIDTETTGLHARAEVVQLSVIDSEGNEVLDTLIRPFYPIPQEATNIHGITNEMVNLQETPTIVHAVLVLLHLVQEKFPDGDFQLVGYNTSFDTKMIIQSLSITKQKLQRKSDKTLSDDEKLNLPDVVDNLKAFITTMKNNSRCIMREYQDYSGNNRWVKLVQAASDCNVKIKDAHTAKGDCLMTLGVMKYIDRM
ncbi:3'-5' exonuclease [Aliivibrio finisterrensis]|uniref:3'-5' exonuclease n=1 Tax=Aliivibrio finisterrensis TaxID=511998 RepID=A0A4V1Z5Y8_9GAMM|nr:3'-5' exonuclease [Aliivibrio finisterrensis]RYU39970.1 3'-5' exonuclease [Aliivibrio finisterrensis]